MHKYRRPLLLFVLSGLIWYACFYVFFILSGAQNILANPDYQSSKFLRVFMEIAPAPRVVSDPYLIYKGFYLIGLFSSIVLVYLNDKLKGNWLRKGFILGMIQWALMIPWFEFYLPYNVMHEPINLVLFEAILWLGSILCIAFLSSFIINFKVNNTYES